MKRLLIIGLLALQIGMIMAGCSEDDSDGQVFISERYKCSMIFPKDWDLMVYRTRRTPVLGFRPKANSFEVFRENVGIMIWKYKTSQNFDDCSNKILSSYKALGKDFRLISEEDITIKDRKVRKIIHSHEANGKYFKVVSYITFNDSKHVCFIVSGTAKLETFYQYAEEFEKITKTLEIWL